MLVAAVSIIGVALVAWSNFSFAMQQQTIANQTNSRINLINESFIIEDVWFYIQSGNYANVTIRNTGDLAIKVTHVYINNTQAWNTGKVIAAGTVEEIKVPTSWGPDRLQSIWVKTERGSEAKQVWKS
ncbi:hypothetical protein Ngar_c24600 [Candidatus Nitrososphaera gargensis Ga9.2]|uniref:Archaeal flagellar protein F n=2 Tax=Candidatus Nitrososphaera gargensis TaxID=497727 RepID=K0INH5_NITGG|nr:hypothetical protein Ngar_c24600 [Candidatus Nitrososphaera gargensis Ga9.2]